MRNLNIKIPGYKSSGTAKTNRWIAGAISVLVLGFFLYCFSDLCSTLAHVVFAQSPVSPVIRWLLALIVLFVCVFGCYALIDEFRRGPKRKRKQRDEHDA